MTRRYPTLLLHHALAALFVAAGTLSVTHFHFQESAGVARAGAATLACGCPGPHHAPPAQNTPGPNPDDCHFCKLSGQLAAESPSAANFCFSILSTSARFRPDLARPAAPATVYLGRGPPVV